MTRMFFNSGKCCTSKTGRVGALEGRYCRKRSGLEVVGSEKGTRME